MWVRMAEDELRMTITAHDGNFAQATESPAPSFLTMKGSVYEQTRVESMDIYTTELGVQP